MVPREDCFVYEVKENETICDIIRRFGVSIKELKEYNGGTDLFSLREGQRLLIKNTPDESENTYELQPEDTLRSVAEKFNTSTLWLLKANPNYMPQEIKHGIRIALP